MGDMWPTATSMVCFWHIRHEHVRMSKNRNAALCQTNTEMMRKVNDGGDLRRIPDGTHRFHDPFGRSRLGAAILALAFFLLAPGRAPGLPAPGGQDSGGGGAPRRIVFIDAAVPDRQVLVDGVQPGTEVVVLD